MFSRTDRKTSENSLQKDSIKPICVKKLKKKIKTEEKKIQFYFLLLLRLFEIKIGVINENQFGRMSCDRDTIIKL